MHTSSLSLHHSPPVFVCVQEVSVLSSSLAQLKSVQRRLNNSKESLSSFSPANKGGGGVAWVCGSQDT